MATHPTLAATATSSATAPSTPSAHAVRRAAIVAGAALALMAVLAPIANFALIPAGDTDPAAALLAAVIALDVVAALALVPVLRPGGRRLAQLAAGLRILYAAAFAVATAQLATGNVEAFQSIWHAALAVFGLHLLLVAALFIRATALPSWLGILVAIAGAGYLADAALVAANSEAAIGQFTFVGEVVLLVWLLGWGGRRRR